MKVRRHFYFSGMVQGVGFRFRARYLADGLGLTGWVKNLWDNRVEMEVQGETASVAKDADSSERQPFYPHYGY